MEFRSDSLRRARVQDRFLEIHAMKGERTVNINYINDKIKDLSNYGACSFMIHKLNDQEIEELKYHGYTVEEKDVSDEIGENKVYLISWL